MERALIEAIDDAMRPALEDAGRDAVLCAIRGDELPGHPEVLIEALSQAADALGGYWLDVPDALGACLDRGDADGVREARLLVEQMTAAAMMLLDAALEDVGEGVDA